MNTKSAQKSILTLSKRPVVETRHWPFARSSYGPRGSTGAKRLPVFPKNGKSNATVSQNQHRSRDPLLPRRQLGLTSAHDERHPFGQFGGVLGKEHSLKKRAVRQQMVPFFQENDIFCTPNKADMWDLLIKFLGHRCSFRGRGAPKNSFENSNEEAIFIALEISTEPSFFCGV